MRVKILDLPKFLSRLKIKDHSYDLVSHRFYTSFMCYGNIQMKYMSEQPFYLLFNKSSQQFPSYLYRYKITVIIFQTFLQYSAIFTIKDIYDDNNKNKFSNFSV